MSEQQEPCTCWLCRDGVPDVMVEQIKKAQPVGEPMTADDFATWLGTIGEDDPASRKQPTC